MVGAAKGRYNRAVLRRLLAAACLLSLSTGCLTAAPVYPVEVQAALAERDMRRLETASLVVYYPAARRDEALRFSARLERCVAELRARASPGGDPEKVLIVVPDAPIQNAFVYPYAAGVEEWMVVPPELTAEFTVDLGITPSPGLVGCHEAVHFVHFEQHAGFNWALRAVFGDLYSPQLGFDDWFSEGLATWYESRLVEGAGRMASPHWRGYVAAGVAGRGLGGGDLHAARRVEPAVPAYLLGSHFVEFLAETYGEDALWRLVEVQSRAVLFPFGVNVRFWQVYGKSLSTLLDEFEAWMQAKHPVRPRPASQRVVREAGGFGRYARANDGTEALLVEDVDRPARLEVRAPDGRVLVDRALAEALPPRTVVFGSAAVGGALAFAADGRTLYLTQVDQGPTQLATRLLALSLPSGELRVVHPDLGGTGGSPTPDGARYLFPKARGDRHELAALDLRTGAIAVLRAEEPGTYLFAPKVSPDGTRVLAGIDVGRRRELWLLDAATGARLRRLGGEVSRHDPSWIDDRRVLFTQVEGGRLQVFAQDLDAEVGARLTDAPYLVANPAAAGGAVRFLNREGWSWALDEVKVDWAALPRPPGGVAATDAAPAPTPGLDLELPSPAILSDAPYSAFDSLLVPRLHAPFVALDVAGYPTVGLALAGNDRLAFHRWALWAAHALGPETTSFGVSYVNLLAAPVELSAAVEQAAHRAILVTAEGGDGGERFTRERHASLSVGRALWGSPLALGATALELHEGPAREVPDGVAAAPARTWRFGGPSVSAAYVGGDATPYAGLRRAVLADASVAGYLGLGEGTPGVVDYGAHLGAVTPLPLSRLHTLRFDLRGRLLAGAEGTGLLLVGGPGAGLPIVARPTGGDPASTFLPPALTFSEPLRGFEDRAVALDRAALGDVTYRLPIPLDAGTASTLGVLPSSFVRQLELQGFASSASDGERGLHAAAGGSLGLLFDVWVLPVELRFQLAKRLTDDRALAPLLLFGAAGSF